jgi:FADH2 O2-dependent halogenase
MCEGFDIAVIGSGFSGSLAAMALARRGRRVVLIESGRHPRFVIGESSTPLTNLWLEEFAREYQLPGVGAFSKWGSWQAEHPGVACGLKRGFTFYQHRLDESFPEDPGRHRQLLVAASPHDRIADTHWYRPDFDHHLVRQAIELGVDYRDQTRIEGIEFDASGALICATRDGVSLEVRVRLVVDASGPRGCLFRLLGAGEDPIPGTLRTETVFAHFRDVARVAGLPGFRAEGIPPYPPDDAALHHVFPGGWIWVLRFNNGVTSAGAALTPGLAAELRVREGAAAWERLLARLPSVAQQFRDARAVTPFFTQSPMPFLCSRASGPGWVMLPSAVGFVDPLLSTGFALTLLGLHQVVGAVVDHWGKPTLVGALADCAGRARHNLLRVGALVGALYRTMDDFPRFIALSKLYFAAASYTETLMRLGRVRVREASFLLADHPVLGPGLGRCIESVVNAPSNEVEATVASWIRDVDVAGLTCPDRRNWFPVEAADLLAAAPRLQATGEELEALLERSGFRRTPGDRSAFPGCRDVPAAAEAES